MSIQILRDPPMGGEGGRVTKKISIEHRGVMGGHQKITEDHNHKKMAKLKVLKKEIITPRISYQVVAQEVISSKTINSM